MHISDWERSSSEITQRSGATNENVPSHPTLIWDLDGSITQDRPYQALRPVVKGTRGINADNSRSSLGRVVVTAIAARAKEVVRIRLVDGSGGKGLERPARKRRRRGNPARSSMSISPSMKTKIEEGVPRALPRLLGELPLLRVYPLEPRGYTRRSISTSFRTSGKIRGRPSWSIC